MSRKKESKRGIVLDIRGAGVRSPMALRELNLTVRRGEAWGVIGANGAGKSTLLKLVCGAIEPCTGKVSLTGTTASLMEAEAGFDAELTVGENIFLNGALFGKTKQFMQERFDETVDFAGVRDLLGQPMKNCSPGMHARLGFAVAAALKPDILIVDDAFAAGDDAFRRKGAERIRELIKSGTAILFASQSAEEVRRLCDHAIWLERGECRSSGKVNEVCDEYERFIMADSATLKAQDGAAAKKGDPSAPHYDYLVVGSGISGATFAYEMACHGKRVLVIDKRQSVGGNIATHDVWGIPVHTYGPHIFHTSDKAVWEFFSGFAQMNGFINCPIANYRGELYNLPFNMNTFSRMWGVVTPAEAEAMISAQRGEAAGEAKNLEQQAISLVGRDIYEKLVKGYTEKQWGRPCTELPPDIIKRLPVRFTYDNNYYNDIYQGVPEGGYTAVIERMLEHCTVLTDTEFFYDREKFEAMSERTVYTGCIDEFFGFSEGMLEYRSLSFREEMLSERDHQGVAVMNYTNADTPYTRIIEHKHFYRAKHDNTVVSYEYPKVWHEGMEPFYPVNDGRNNALYAAYAKKAAAEPRTLFLGRLARYKYLDMDKAVSEALELAKAELLRG